MITVRLMVTRKTCSLITTIPIPPGTYNLQDVIDKLNAEETSDSIRSLSQDQLIQLTNEKKGWLALFDKRQGLLRNCTWWSWRAMPPMETFAG